MFVKSLKTAGKTLVGLTLLSAVGATSAQAYELLEGATPVTVTLKNVEARPGPIYVSLQKRENFMGVKGHGGIVKTAKDGTMTLKYTVAGAGEYAVSVWHDTNEDGVFSMDEQYNVLDGSGMSGSVPTDRPPTFDDVKVKVKAKGAHVSVNMLYPDT